MSLPSRFNDPGFRLTVLPSATHHFMEDVGKQPFAEAVGMMFGSPGLSNQDWEVNLISPLLPRPLMTLLRVNRSAEDRLHAEVWGEAANRTAESELLGWIHYRPMTPATYNDTEREGILRVLDRNSAARHHLFCITTVTAANSVEISGYVRDGERMRSVRVSVAPPMNVSKRSRSGK